MHSNAHAPADAAPGWRRRLQTLTRPRTREALPIHFDRRRIYLLPTGFGLFFAAAMAVMALGALNYNNNPALLLCLLLCGAALAGLFVAQRQLDGLEMTALDAEPAAAGQPLTVRVCLRAAHGGDRAGLWLGYGPARTPISLRGGDGDARLHVQTQRRGWLELERLRLESTLPLGLARAWADAWPTTRLLVYPAPEPNGPALPPATGGRAGARPRQDGEEMHQLRDYRRGDPTRIIAWKPSARRGALLVREHQQAHSQEVALDWDDLHMLPWETRIARLTHWVEAAERQRRRYRLRLPGQPPLGPDHGPAHRHACLRALALLPPAEDHRR